MPGELGGGGIGPAGGKAGADALPERAGTVNAIAGGPGTAAADPTATKGGLVGGGGMGPAANGKWEFGGPMKRPAGMLADNPGAAPILPGGEDGIIPRIGGPMGLMPGNPGGAAILPDMAGMAALIVGIAGGPGIPG